MNLRRVWAIARKEYLHVVRDFRSLLMAICHARPADDAVRLCPVARRGQHPAWPSGIRAGPRGAASSSAGSTARAIFRSRHVRQLPELERAIDTGRGDDGAGGAARFRPADRRRPRVPVQLIVDGTDSNTATIAIGYADVVAQIYALDLTIEQNQRRGGPPLQIPLDVRPRVWFNEELESRNFIIPGLIAVIMMVIAALMTSLTVAREWERGTMEQLISTPVKARRTDPGQALPYFAIGMFDVLLAVLMGEFVFHVPLRGNVALLFGMATIFLIGALSMGMVVSIVTKSQLLSIQVAVVATFLPAFLLSGFIFTIANMPRGDPDRHLPRAGAVLRGHPEGDLSERRGAGDPRRPGGMLVFYGTVMVLLAERLKFREEVWPRRGEERHVRARQAHADQGVHPGLPRPADAGRDLRDSLLSGAGDRLRRLDRREARAHGRLRPGQQPGQPRADRPVRSIGLFRHRGRRVGDDAAPEYCSTAATSTWCCDSTTVLPKNSTPAAPPGCKSSSTAPTRTPPAIVLELRRQDRHGLLASRS